MNYRAIYKKEVDRQIAQLEKEIKEKQNERGRLKLIGVQIYKGYKYEPSSRLELPK